MLKFEPVYGRLCVWIVLPINSSLLLPMPGRSPSGATANSVGASSFSGRLPDRKGDQCTSFINLGEPDAGRLRTLTSNRRPGRLPLGTGGDVTTFSGFSADPPLRQAGAERQLYFMERLRSLAPESHYADLLKSARRNHSNVVGD